MKRYYIAESMSTTFACLCLHLCEVLCIYRLVVKLITIYPLIKVSGVSVSTFALQASVFAKASPDMSAGMQVSGNQRKD